MVEPARRAGAQKRMSIWHLPARPPDETYRFHRFQPL